MIDIITNLRIIQNQEENQLTSVSEDLLKLSINRLSQMYEKLSTEKLLQSFVNGKERYERDVMFNSVIKSIEHGNSVIQALDQLLLSYEEISKLYTEKLLKENG